MEDCTHHCDGQIPIGQKVLYVHNLKGALDNGNFPQQSKIPKMATDKQKLGDWGEKLVSQKCACPKCKREKTTRLLPPNFRCADLICDFCGYLAQVKTSNVKNVDELPSTILGAAWGPQKERMESGIYFPLFVVLTTADKKQSAIYFLPADLQTKEMFVARKPLSATARRAGWQGYLINCEIVRSRFVRLI